MGNKIICWWSGGITSAVACHISITTYGKDNCKVIMIDTHNEDPDTYRFKRDCETWYGIPIETISAIGSTYNSIQDVWVKHKSLNVATGAVCSSELKRAVREKWQKSNTFEYQVFGFEFSKKEFNRALSMVVNHPDAKPIFPLLMRGLDKKACIDYVKSYGITVPITYQLGFKNNNCFNTGCVQGGIGYWQKMRVEFPDKFNNMADMEHTLTTLKGVPVTMLKDQSLEAKQNVKLHNDKTRAFIFLKKNSDYPHLKCLDDMKIQKVEPLFECNGFCGVNDLIDRGNEELDINYD